MSQANRIGFRDFFKKLDKEKDHIDLIIDANVIIAGRDKEHKDNKTVRKFFADLKEATKSYTLFTTVTTKSEFLEYYRRKIITKAILDLYKDNKEQRYITEKAYLGIQGQLRERNRRQNNEVKRQEKNEKVLEDEGFDILDIETEAFSVDANYFKDSEIKEIKKAFRARTIQSEVGWLKLCETSLGSQLHDLEKNLDEMCYYLTTRDEEAKKFFTQGEVKWRNATQICAETAMGYSDAMILNMANHTSIKHIFSLDYDIIYGGHISGKNKVLIIPDKRLKNFKQTLKGI